MARLQTVEFRGWVEDTKGANGRGVPAVSATKRFGAVLHVVSMHIVLRAEKAETCDSDGG